MCALTGDEAISDRDCFVTALRAMTREGRPCLLEFVEPYVVGPRRALAGFDKRLEA